jgi:hypothetical protein
MDCHEFMCIPINLIPGKVLQEYQPHNLVDSKGFVLAHIKKGMYGLPQKGMLANKLLNSDWDPMATMHASTGQDCGNTTIDQSNSHS